MEGTAQPRHRTGAARRAEARYGVVLALALALVAWLLAGPASAGPQLAGAVAIASALASAAWWAARERAVGTRSLLATVLGTILVAALLGLLVSLVGGATAQAVASAWLLAAGTVAPLLVARGLVRHARVDLQLLLGMLAIYVLLGVVVANVLALVAAVQDDALLRTPDGLADGSFRDKVYFAFATLTTTGYGDLAPASGTARSIAVLTAMAGQLYLVTAVAAVVGILATKRA